MDRIKKLQSIELEIMDFIHCFCESHKIKYTVSGGNLIGAIRHHGFIPWDDDFDIYMNRENYQKFTSLWKNTDKYYMEKEGPDSDITINHTKICKNGTLCTNNREIRNPGHHGIWVDVFVVDKLPNEEDKRKKMLFWAKIRIVLTRKSLYKQGSFSEGLISFFCLLIPSFIRKPLRKRAEQEIQKHNDMKTDFEYICCAAPYMLKLIYPSTIFDDLQLVPYETSKYYISSQYDLMLRLQYGDYMQLPPEEDRTCKHNPEILEFGE